MAIYVDEVSARIEKMYAYYASGASLREVGQEFGISGERVRQVLQHHGYPIRSVGEAHAARNARRSAELRKLRPAIRELEAEGYEPDEISNRLGISKTEVKITLRDVYRSQGVKVSQQRARHGRSKKLSTADEMLECLRQASDSLGGVLSTDAYRRFAAGRTFSDGRPWPGPQTIFKEFGSWVDALKAAGLAANPRSPIAGRRIFEEEHCLDAIRHARRELGRVPSAREYDEMARASSGGLPSLATVRNRCDGWTAALAKAGF